MNIQEVLSRPEYQFIQTNPHLGGSMLFATFGGSHSYGTNVEAVSYTHLTLPTN